VFVLTLGDIRLTLQGVPVGGKENVLDDESEGVGSGQVNNTGRTKAMDAKPFQMSFALCLLTFFTAALLWPTLQCSVDPSHNSRPEW